MLSVFAATMLEYERLERWRGRRPRASRRLAASVSVSPTSSICGPVAIG
jgi:hypothetical protein